MKKLPLILLSIAPAHAALVIEETFTYETGALSGETGGIGFSGAWQATRNNPSVSDPGLSAGDLASAGFTSRGNAWSGVQRPIGTSLSSAGLMDNGASLWFSVIFDLTGANTANADINLALSSDQFVAGTFGDRENLDSGQGIGIGHSGGNIRGVSWLNQDADLIAERTESPASSLTLNGAGGNPTVALIVGRIDWGTLDTDGETITLFAPAPDLTLGTEILSSWTTDPLTQSTFDRVAIQYKDTPQVDEIRFGSTSEDVLPSSAIPEPSSAILLALGSLALGVSRRR